MALGALTWDEAAARKFMTGVDHGVLYHQTNGVYNDGEAWNGLINVTEQPSGAESNKFYADNIEYFNILSAEQFGATIECYMAPDGFLTYDGVVKTVNGVQIGMQPRGAFGFAWRSKTGTAANEEAGYVLHLAYGCKASPAEKAHNTVNETPEPGTFSWTLSTSPVSVSGHRPTAIVKIDSTDPTVSLANLADLELVLFGAPGVAPRLPLPDEVDAIMGTGILTATPVNPTYDSGTDTITIPNVAGVDYVIDGEVVAAGPVVITADTIVDAVPESGYTFTGVFVTRWMFDFS